MEEQWINNFTKIKEMALEEHIPIIMDETLEVIGRILEKNKPTKILEIGTAVGYSAICFSKYLVIYSIPSTKYTILYFCSSNTASISRSS